ncbi:MAG: hypothetical protein AMXMBFR56_54780 [Polyangiaceae bacterium]
MAHRSAKRLRVAALVALALLAPAVVHGDRTTEARDPEAPVYCVQAWTEARYRNYGYDHIVHLYNGCASFATCQVSTNVAPKPIVVRIKPAALIEILTYRGSPSTEFVARVTCVLDEE